MLKLKSLPGPKGEAGKGGGVRKLGSSKKWVGRKLLSPSQGQQSQVCTRLAEEVPGHCVQRSRALLAVLSPSLPILADLGSKRAGKVGGGQGSRS
jgi:hypothetical protein